MDTATVARWRMRNLALADTHCADPAAVVRHLAVVQGQDLLPSWWSLAQRCAEPVTLTEVEHAFAAGEFLRTHALRPTWQLVAPEDIRWVLTATAPRVHQINKHMYRQLDLDPNTLDRATDMFRDVLTTQQLTRRELGEALADHGIVASGQRLAYIAMHAELEAVICSGPPRGKQQTYTLLDHVAPGTEHRSRDDALDELLRRYLPTRAPATVKDFARWASLTLTEARSAVARAADAVETFDLDGHTYLIPAGATPPGEGEDRVDLVQGLDELGMSYSESRHVLTEGVGLAAEAPTPYFHSLIRGGRLIGYWRYVRDSRGRPTLIEIRFAARPPVGMVDEAVARFAVFADTDVAWTEV